jgi:hypothetical protein
MVFAAFLTVVDHSVPAQAAISIRLFIHERDFSTWRALLAANILMDLKNIYPCVSVVRTPRLLSNIIKQKPTQIKILHKV